MKLHKLLLPLAGAALVSTSMTASAKDSLMDKPGWFIGGGAGVNRVEDDQFITNDDDIDETNTIYKGLVGLRFNRMFSFEGQYIDFGTAEGGRSSVDAQGWNASVMLSIPVWILTIHGKGGLLFWESDRAIPAAGATGQIERDGDGEDLTYGVGVSLGITDAIAVRAEYERFEFGNIDDDGTGSRAEGVEVDTASVSLVWNF